MSVATASNEVFQKTDFGHQKAATGPPRDEFPRAQTHGIALWPKHHLLADSRGLGWNDSYTSLATESSWNGTLNALPHLCIAHCVHRSASVSRTIDGESAQAKTVLRPRLLGVVPENRSSQWDLRGTPDIQLVYLRRRMVEQVAGEMLGVDAERIEMVPRLGFSDPLIEQLMLALLDAARTDDGSGDGLYADHVARLMALHVLRHHTTRPLRRTPASCRPLVAVDARINHVHDLIESALDENLSLERLARAAGISAHAFSAAFARTCGVTPHRYVIGRRIERAKQLLRGEQISVAEIALLTGFASQSHLATAFKRAVGVTPGQYQRADASR